MARAVKEVRFRRLYCTTCRKEVPGSEARIADARGRLVHFCGINCFDRWWKRSSHPQESTARHG